MYRTTFLNEFFSSTRFKSFVWRAGAMGAVAVIGVFQVEITNYPLRPEIVAVLGLILGEITKALNNVAKANS
jgi:hypothetical protein